MRSYYGNAEGMAHDADFFGKPPIHLDRLALLSIGIGLFALVTGSVLLEFEATRGTILLAALMGLGAVQLLVPRNFLVTFAIAFVFLTSYIQRLPDPSDSALMAAFLMVVILIVSVYSVRRTPLSRLGRAMGDGALRRALFMRIATPGAWLLAILYAYGIFHRLNTGFLDPVTSCASGFYDALAGHPWIGSWELAAWERGREAAIWLTLAVQGLAILFLLSGRFKKLGFLIEIPFHGLIGLAGIGFAVDFSILVLTLYVLFLPASFCVHLSRLVGMARQRSGLLPFASGLLIRGAALLLTLVFVWGMGQAAATDADRSVWIAPFFAAIVALYFVAVLVFMPVQIKGPSLYLFDFRPGLTALVPALFFLNGLSPYVGLKTESAMALYSNLHAQGHKNNHLLLPALPLLSDRSRDLVQILHVTDPALDAAYADKNRRLVRYQFDRLLAMNPDTVFSFAHDDKVYRTSYGADVPSWENTYDETHWLVRNLIGFKPVERQTPDACRP